MMNKQERLLLSLYFLYFVLSFCVFSGTIPYQSYIKIILLILILFLQKNYPLRMPVNTSMIFVWTILVVSVITNVSSEKWITNIAQLIQITLLWILVLQYCQSWKRWYDIIRILFISTLIGGPVIGVIQLIKGGYLYNSQLDMTFASIVVVNANQNNSNYSAITMLIPMVLGCVLCAQSRKKLFYGASVLFSLLAFVMTYSRGGIAAFALAVVSVFGIYYTKKSRKKIKKQGLILMSFLFLLAIIMCIFFGQSIFKEIGIKISENELLQTLLKFKSTSKLSGRMQQWNACIEAFMNGNFKQKIMGYGNEYAEYLALYSGNLMTAHNIFFGQLAENGIIGGISIIWFYARVLKKSVQLSVNDSESRYIAVLVLTVCFMYMLISSFIFEFFCIFIIFDAFIALKHQKKRENKSIE